MRLNKFLATVGFCSRRKAEDLINRGKVLINGQKADITTPILKGDIVSIGSHRFSLKDVPKKSEKETYAFYKPRGIICTLADGEHPNILDCLTLEARVFPVGRLDRDSEGLLILTTDGDLAQRLSHPSFEHEKEYRVWLGLDIDDQDLETMRNGVEIDSGKTLPCQIEREAGSCFRIILKEGKNRQIRKMCEFVGHRVKKLVRIRIGQLAVQLKPGELRALGAKQVRKLQMSSKTHEKREK